jgi:hypothetical protein
VLCALAVALIAPRSAFAAAPMCDPSGASAVAPIPALPTNTGELSAPKACESPHDGMQIGHGRQRSPVVRAAPDIPERVVVALPSLPRIAGRLIARPDSIALPYRPGFSDPVYRPPRAA